MQPHIATKILDMPSYFNDLKSLQKFLGLVNYARSFIPKLGIIAGPLYGKISPTGLRSFNKEDSKLVDQIKTLVAKLPTLKRPLVKDYLIIESDGCEDGWGAVLKARPDKFSPVTEEQVCCYGSGKFREKGQINSIDAEILAICYALDKFHFYLIDKTGKESFLIRTDCEAIVRFHKNSEKKNCSKRRWLNFLNTISSFGFTPEFAYLKGEKNTFATISLVNLKALTKLSHSLKIPLMFCTIARAIFAFYIICLYLELRILHKFILSLTIIYGFL